jgi:transposase
MKKLLETLGVDVSKETLDAYLHIAESHQQFDNNLEGFKAMISWARKTGSVRLSELLICFEHTGIYGMQLAAYLEKRKLFYCMVPALEIKRSLGMVRGKDDKVDSRRIAQYAHLRRETIKQTKLPSLLLQKLKQLLSLRGNMVTQRAGYKAKFGELKRVYKKSELKVLLETQEKLIRELSRSIDKVEAEIIALINSNPEVKRVYKLITSIKGIGPIVATNLIVVTQCFTTFENSRKLACYCGVAPFKKRSGSSLKSRSRVSHYANKKLKSLLNLAASSATQARGEMKTYYDRRIEAGKSKMSTLNIVRNKLLHRVFAVVKRGTPYVEIYGSGMKKC